MSSPPFSFLLFPFPYLLPKPQFPVSDFLEESDKDQRIIIVGVGRRGLSKGIRTLPLLSQPKRQLLSFIPFPYVLKIHELVPLIHERSLQRKESDLFILSILSLILSTISSFSCCVVPIFSCVSNTCFS